MWQRTFGQEPAQPGALADAIRRVLADYDGARRLAAAGTRLVRAEFEIRENVRRLIAEIAAVTG